MQKVGVHTCTELNVSDDTKVKGLQPLCTTDKNKATSTTKMMDT